MRRLRLRPSLVVMVVGLALTLGAVALMPPPRGVFWARTNLTFLSPREVTMNPYGPGSSDLVSFAAAVERQYNGGPARAPAASSDAPLFGRGVRVGSAVTLPNTGSQWRPTYNSALLVVEAVSPDQQEAERILAQTVAELEEIARQRQADANVKPQAVITTAPVPAAPIVTYVSGSARRAQAAAMMVGALVTISVAVLVEARTRRREEAELDELSTRTPVLAVTD